MEAEQVTDLARKFRKHALLELPAARRVELGRADVERLLQHRPPFLFVEQITAADLDGLGIAGRRRIDPADPVFAGHFPGAPIYPGVLQLETMGQLALCLLAMVKNGRSTTVDGDRPPSVRALKIHHASFLAPVGPGDELEILARVLERDDYLGVCAGQLLRGGSICSLAIMEVYFVEA